MHPQLAQGADKKKLEKRQIMISCPTQPWGKNKEDVIIEEATLNISVEQSVELNEGNKNNQSLGKLDDNLVDENNVN